jgi:hypothetical protein
MNILKRSIGLSIALIIIFLSLEGRQIWRGSIFKKGGVTNIENPAEPIYKDGILQLTPEFIIPGTDSQGQYLFVRPGYLALDNHNNIYVMDWKESCIYVFSEFGRYLRKIGRPGAGPGELDGLTDFLVADNYIVASCGMNRRISTFDKDGQFIKSQAAPSKISRFQVDRNGNIYGIVVNSSIKTVFELVKFDSEFNRVSSLTSRNASEPGTLQGGLSFDILNDGKIVVGAPSQYEFYIFNSSGILEVVIKKNSKPVRLLDSEIDLIKKSSGGDTRNIPQFHAPYYQVQTCGRDKILVKTHSTSADGRKDYYDVFDIGGKFLSSFGLKHYNNQLWKNDRLFITDEDEEGTPIIRVFKVKWKNGLGDDHNSLSPLESGEEAAGRRPDGEPGANKVTERRPWN